VVNVKGSIASLRVAVILLLIATSVARFDGMVELTVGAVVSVLDFVQEYATSVMASIIMSDTTSQSMFLFFI
jgi:hypothetical protein